MKDLLKTNCYDIEKNIIIVGSCLPDREPKAFEALKVGLCRWGTHYAERKTN